jgi:hypothetical protein
MPQAGTMSATKNLVCVPSRRHSRTDHDIALFLTCSIDWVSLPGAMEQARHV